MYSGLTIFSKYSGRVFGTHQKIDRVARKHLDTLLKGRPGFPGSRKILQFEGLNGPDGIKRKSPAQNEPWHYIDPFDKHDTDILQIIADHYSQLTKALREQNEARAAFEAAWLAHAVVDGLTPAHHYPYEEKLAELRGGEGLETRTTIKKKLIMPGATSSEKLKNNWKMWGPRGLYTTHMSFEMGVASLMSTMSFRNVQPTPADVAHMQKATIDDWFLEAVQQVARLRLFETFSQQGWNVGLARQIRRDLAPLLVRSIILIWYRAALEAGLAEVTT